MTAALLRPRPAGNAGDAEQPGGAAEVDSAILRVSGGVGYVPRWSRPRRSRPCLSRPCRVPYHSFAHYSASPPHPFSLILAYCILSLLPSPLVVPPSLLPGE